MPSASPKFPAPCGNADAVGDPKNVRQTSVCRGFRQWTSGGNVRQTEVCRTFPAPLRPTAAWLLFFDQLLTLHASRLCFASLPFTERRRLKPLKRKPKAYTTESRAKATTTDAINRPRASTCKEFWK